MYAPQIVMVQLGRRWRFEAGDVNTYWIDTRKHFANDPILAAGIHGLQHHQHFVLVLGVQRLLQFNKLRIEFCKDADGCRLIPFETAGGSRINVGEPGFSVGDDRAHGFDVNSFFGHGWCPVFSEKFHAIIAYPIRYNKP